MRNINSVLLCCRSHISHHQCDATFERETVLKGGGAEERGDY